jgi:hypothetical protein
MDERRKNVDDDRPVRSQDVGRTQDHERRHAEVLGRYREQISGIPEERPREQEMPKSSAMKPLSNADAYAAKDRAVRISTPGTRNGICIVEV